MNTVNVYWRYDLFKLIVTMLLLLILLLSFPKPGPNPPIAEGDSGEIVTATGGSHPEDLEPGNPDSPQYPLLPPFPPASGNLAIAPWRIIDKHRTTFSLPNNART